MLSKKKGYTMYDIIVFSTTGNSNYVAKKIKNSLSDVDDNISIHQLEKITDYSNFTNEHLILISTIRAFEFPQVVINFVKKIPYNFKYVSIIGVGCNTEWINSASSMKVKKILNSKNINLIVDTTVAMPLNLIKPFPPELIKNLLEQFDYDVITISNDIKKLNKSDRIVPFKSICLSKINIIERNAVKLFGLELYSNNKCIKCNKCVIDCPTKNIRFKGDKLKFGFKCMMCLRCIYECPTKAISPRFSKFVLIKGGYDKLS